MHLCQLTFNIFTFEMLLLPFAGRRYVFYIATADIARHMHKIERGDLMKSDFRNYRETQNENERTVTYDSYVNGVCRCHTTVHIPGHSPEEQAEYEKNVRAALRRFYYHVTEEMGADWDAIVAKHREEDEVCIQYAPDYVPSGG